MGKLKGTSLLVMLHILGNTLAYDGCNDGGWSWRCGDKCILYSAECSCGGQIFNHTAGKWCCQDSPCTGKGDMWNKGTEKQYWEGERDDNGQNIGADCSGKPLNLTQACNQTCNYYKDDKYRGQRSFVACNTTELNITQCIPETDLRNGKFDCRNRADELPFLTGIGNSSSLLLDLDDILTPCTYEDGYQGFRCSAAPSGCLRLDNWCDPSWKVYTCDELRDRTATETTIDYQL